MSNKVYLVIGALMDDRWVHAAFSDPLAAEECRRVLTAQQSRRYYEIEEVELDPPSAPLLLQPGVDDTREGAP